MLSNESFDLGRPCEETVGLERLVAEFERGWRRGERPAIEQALSPARDQRRTALVELVHAELEFRLKAGDSARVEDYTARGPD